MIFGFFLSLISVSFFKGNTEGSFMEIFTFFFVQLFLIVFIKTKNNLSFSNSYVSLVFVLLLAIIPNIIKINLVLFTNLALLLSFRKIYSLQSPKKSFQKLFDSGLWLGVAFILEPFSLVFIALLYIAIYLHDHFTIQTIVIPLVGLACPLLFYYTYCLWYEKTDAFFNLFHWYTNYDMSFYTQLNYLIPLIFIACISFLGILLKTPKVLYVMNDFRKSWILVLINVICAVGLLVLVKDRNGSEILYLLFPASIIIGNLVEIYEHKWFSDLFLAVFISFAITVCLF